MPAAPSDARNTATSTTSASLGARHSAAIPAIISTTDRGSGGFAPPTSVSFFSDSVSATPAVQMPQTRTPRGPTSAARYRMNASVAASAGPVLPIPGIAPAPDALLRCKITPKPCSIMSRPAARAVRKLLRRPLTTARKRSSAVISTSGVPWTSPRRMRLNDTYAEKPLWSPAAHRQLDSAGKLSTHEHIRR